MKRENIKSSQIIIKTLILSYVLKKLYDFYQLDNNGNTTKKDYHTGLEETMYENYLWNSQNQMTGYRKYERKGILPLFDLTEVVDFSYNVAGMRLSKKVVNMKTGLLDLSSTSALVLGDGTIKNETIFHQDVLVSNENKNIFDFWKENYYNQV